MGKYSVQLSSIVVMTVQGRGVHEAIQQAKDIIHETFEAKGLRMMATFAPHVICLESDEKMPSTFGFGDALNHIKEGKQVSRLAWAGAEGYVRQERGCLIKKQGRFTLNGWWTPGQDDCLADDWYLYGSQEGELVDLHNNTLEPSVCVPN